MSFLPLQNKSIIDSRFLHVQRENEMFRFLERLFQREIRQEEIH